MEKTDSPGYHTHLFLCHCPFKGLCKYVCKEMAVLSQGSWVTPWGRIPQGDWLCAVWYLGRLTRWGFLPWRDSTQILTSDSPEYDTPGRFTLRSLIPRGDWLCAVWYPRDIDSPGYYTLGRFIKIRISQQNQNQNQKYFNPLVSCPGWFKWWKKLEVENLVGLSL